MPRRKDFATEQEFRAALLASKRDYMRGYHKEHRASVPADLGLGNVARPDLANPLTVAAFQERARAYGAGHQSIVAAIAGDPLPGRSALDRSRR